MKYIVIDVMCCLLLYYNIIAGNKYFIRDGYPWGLPIDDVTTTRTRQSLQLGEVRRANADKISEGWNVFIEELKAINKFINE